MSDNITNLFKPAPSWRVDPFMFEGAVLYRAHVWKGESYSSKTFSTAAEAHAWITHGAKK